MLAAHVYVIFSIVCVREIGALTSHRPPRIIIQILYGGRLVISFLFKRKGRNFNQCDVPGHERKNWVFIMLQNTYVINEDFYEIAYIRLCRHLTCHSLFCNATIFGLPSRSACCFWNINICYTPGGWHIIIIKSYFNDFECFNVM